MHSPFINYLTLLLLYSLLAISTPTNPDESLHISAAIDDSAKSDPVNGVHTLNERHKHNDEWKIVDVSNYGGNPGKRQVDNDEPIVVPEVKKKHHDGSVTRALVVKTVPLVENPASLSADDASLSSAGAVWDATHISARNADLAETQSMGIHKRHGHHHTTTAPITWNAASDSADYAFHASAADAYDALQASSLSAQQAYVSSEGGYTVHGKRITSTAQQAEQTYDAASQTPSEAQELNVINEEPSHDQPPALPDPQHTPTSG